MVDASRGFRSWNISGLKDPIARSPATVLSAVGANTSRLSGQWREYLSLDPAIVAARAKRAVDSVARIVESKRVLFDAGSSALNPVAIATLAGIATFVHELDRNVATSGGTVTLELTGRTDPTGADATNALLAEQRIDNVARWLESSGFDARRLTRNPAATSSPLPANDPVEGARINRSVSFTVRASVPATLEGRQ